MVLTWGMYATTDGWLAMMSVGQLCVAEVVGWVGTCRPYEVLEVFRFDAL